MFLSVCTFWKFGQSTMHTPHTIIIMITILNWICLLNVPMLSKKTMPDVKLNKEKQQWMKASRNIHAYRCLAKCKDLHVLLSTFNIPFALFYYYEMSWFLSIQLTMLRKQKQKNALGTYFSFYSLAHWTRSTNQLGIIFPFREFISKTVCIPKLLWIFLVIPNFSVQFESHHGDETFVYHFCYQSLSFYYLSIMTIIIIIFAHTHAKENDFLNYFIISEFIHRKVCSVPSHASYRAN